MEIQPIHQASIAALQKAKNVHAGPVAGHAEKANHGAASLAKISKADLALSIGDLEPASPGDVDSQKTPGVLRLLEAGHFKGVADVRLRINFFDELSAQANADVASVAQQESAKITETVDAAVDELIVPFAADEHTQELVAEMVGAFDTAVLAAAEDIPANEGLDPEVLTAGIQGAFDTLVEQLTTLLQPPIDEPDAPPTQEPYDVVEELNGDTSTPLDDAIASLVAVFGDALAALSSAIKTASQLPDPSPPSGHGVAYEKFLAIYNELRSVEGSVDEQA